MSDGIVWVNPGLCYRARILSQFDPKTDTVYHIGLLRYHYDPQTKQPLECYYWSHDDTWTQYPIGGEYRPLGVPRALWPEGARDFLKLVSDADARRALSEAIDETVKHEQTATAEGDQA